MHRYKPIVGDVLPWIAQRRSTSSHVNSAINSDNEVSTMFHSPTREADIQGVTLTAMPRPSDTRQMLPAVLCLLLVLMSGSAHAMDDRWLGAAFEGDQASLEDLAAAGAKVVKVYRQSDIWVLDEAGRLGMKVVMGLWIPHRRHGAELHDPKTVEDITRDLVAYVKRYKDHPALLAWAVGNEVETGEADPRFAWNIVDRISAAIKNEDPAHPTIMVVADTGPQEYRWLADCCEHVDILGLNIYGGAIFNLPDRLRAAKIDKPVVITELGPLGQWQAGTKPWGAPVELTSRQKAEFFRDALAFIKERLQIKGTFAFLWGAKQEQTSTWHGMTLRDGMLTEMTDALSTAWGKPPKTHAPTIRGIGISADTFEPGQTVSAGIDALSPGGSTLRAEWRLFHEATDLRKGGDEETPPAEVSVPFEKADAEGARFVAPSMPGAYRLFITLKDDSHKAATANLPFLVVAP